MLDIKKIREDFEGVKAAVERRGKGDFGIGEVAELDKKRREVLAKVEAMKNQQSTTSKQIPKMKKAGEDTTELMAEMKKLSQEIKALDAEVSEIEENLKNAILNIPNTPHERISPIPIVSIRNGIGRFNPYA
jgi:seryl-tRNA synthetase